MPKKKIKFCVSIRRNFIFFLTTSLFCQAPAILLCNENSAVTKIPLLSSGSSLVWQSLCCCYCSVMLDSVRPHRWQPNRLFCPWDSPGKNTGVGCHFLLQGTKVKNESQVAQSCLTLSDSMDSSLPGSSVLGILLARVLEWVAIAFSEQNYVN